MTEKRKTPKEHKVDGKTTPPSLSDDESSLFRTSIGDTRPLPDNGKTVFPPHLPWPVLRQNRADENPLPTDGLSDYIPQELAGTEEEFYFLRPGVAPLTMKRLRRGHWAIQAELDLHGMTSDEARACLTGFLDECKQLGLRCVRVIHGKGLSSRNHEPVLKQKTASWLMQRDEILAFCQARPMDGGSGAVIVLLKVARL
ncbi:Smr/MutS family protein [Sulfuricella sp.]|uniref:Smr/MutS family protein n=1 Tax=Sulfuricella sp. TaxID=2099377 RepID=UPI002BC723A2|nr:Smr/MutS family protein [Sulfuricella sp.]HUX62767.1 Smr/MutS family protein [Sulfuricella sp.]